VQIRRPAQRLAAATRLDLAHPAAASLRHETPLVSKTKAVMLPDVGRRQIGEQIKNQEPEAAWSEFRMETKIDAENPKIIQKNPNNDLISFSSLPANKFVRADPMIDQQLPLHTCSNEAVPERFQ
jgi:hypothetical protein